MYPSALLLRHSMIGLDLGAFTWVESELRVKGQGRRGRRRTLGRFIRSLVKMWNSDHLLKKRFGYFFSFRLYYKTFLLQITFKNVFFKFNFIMLHNKLFSLKLRKVLVQCLPPQWISHITQLKTFLKVNVLHNREFTCVLPWTWNSSKFHQKLSFKRHWNI